ncbi:MAG: acyltransferase family protein [Myxococcaceae bacterium]|nr:acyltransferase family protein [Myxococcaceae bacterium]
MSKRDRQKPKGSASADKPAAQKPSPVAAKPAARKSPPPAAPPLSPSPGPVATTAAVVKAAPKSGRKGIPASPVLDAPKPATAAKRAPPATAGKDAAAAPPAQSGAAPLAGRPKPAPRPGTDASSALTVAPPAKRARASQPQESSPVPATVLAAPAPGGQAPGPAVNAVNGVNGVTHVTHVTPSAPSHAPHVPYVEPATPAEPTLEEAAAIAVRSDRADSEAAARLARGSSGDRLREAAAFGSSQSLLSTDYYFRQYGAHGMRSMVADVDDFGFDPHVDNKVKPLLEAVCKRYFRVELVGAEHIPERGRALLVANRAGTLPWDGLVLRTALRSQRPALSPLRWLAEDSVIHYPFMGVFMNRLGAVRACPENAERLLAQDRLVAVFPEGAQGSRKLFRDRYRLQRFGRGGYVKLALKLGVPIFPTAIIGAEEINPVLGRSRFLGRIVGSESVPLTPTFPWLGLAGLLPAPVRWRIAVGAPIDLSSYGPESADDALVVHRLNEQIRSALQALVDQGKQARGSALFG